MNGGESEFEKEERNQEKNEERLSQMVKAFYLCHLRESPFDLE